MVEESHRHRESANFGDDPRLGPIRVTQLLPIVVTPHRFRPNRQFWSYPRFRDRETLVGDLPLSQEPSASASPPVEASAPPPQRIPATPPLGQVLLIKLLDEAVQAEASMRYHEPPMVYRPALQTLGDINLAAGRWTDARDAYQALLDARPRSGHAVYGIAQSYELAGDKANARAAYKEFLEAWRTADNDLPQIQHARQWVD